MEASVIVANPNPKNENVCLIKAMHLDRICADAHAQV